MTIVIAEFGSSPAPAWEFDAWCAAAFVSGADAVKIQVFRAEHFPPPHDRLKVRDVFPREKLAAFVQAAHARGLGAGASVFDAEAVELVAAQCDFLKLAAREQDNQRLLDVTTAAAERHGRPVLRSVSSLRGRGHYAHPRFTHLFAIQEYPAGLAKSLYWLTRAALHFRRYGLREWGWSSHTRGQLDCVLAARLGAAYIEKHFALSASNSEAGHSLLPAAFGRMVAAVKGA